ncbi:Gfo/Idh/MocA family oxidoreductase [Xenorhabdus griffiniae]|uniref:Gfo/Idh/MocA family oxidoreductase n=1 Tax=Xenorhabdus griffiniae TaxID=351672 RepID=A0ABY9XN56_9GAMM|nr:Gfo/Idh/MocA family oxidoreductase [Xenorhabdus griffiniae]MBD1227459.1 Gfo/Idh/MocA family oxidoreductase [Xenorhabdus griffiniae]MBE8586109.1 Gfo/Idh/MocA family oxidoreductase [Xenorhabdus griffiniae]WMV74212.1 Gfo/Idh/MocA family oxidoreductase [Xenorhabdus griffiniae]WNH03892.1 Gfo/Idh/MocA family oxidoreductase [Xenorhabdus griffiniae]
MIKLRRVLIVGSKFGELYLNAFLQPRSDLELAGILAQGSPRSQQLARDFNVPLFRSLDELPDDIDIACVVIRAEVIGGEGDQLTQALLARGISVIQEHPLDAEAIKRHQSTANQHNAMFWVNSFYSQCQAGRSWLHAAHQIEQLSRQRPVSGYLTTSRQLLFSALDLLLQGCHCPEQIEIAYVGQRNNAFHRFELSIAGTTITLDVQSYLDPRDPDMHNLVMHKMTLIWPAGYLTQEASYGPVIWTPVLHAPNHLNNGQSLYLHAGQPEGAYLHQTTSQILCPATQNWMTAFECDGAEGVARLLNTLNSVLNGALCPPAFSYDYQLRLAGLWQQILRMMGEPVTQELQPPVWIDPTQLMLIKEEN